MILCSPILIDPLLKGHPITADKINHHGELVSRYHAAAAMLADDGSHEMGDEVKLLILRKTLSTAFLL